nr:ras-related protein Rab-34 isoform X1 [Chrysemys picta bellii]
MLANSRGLSRGLGGCCPRRAALARPHTSLGASPIAAGLCGAGLLSGPSCGWPGPPGPCSGRLFCRPDSRSPPGPGEQTGLVPRHPGGARSGCPAGEPGRMLCGGLCLPPPPGASACESLSRSSCRGKEPSRLPAPPEPESPPCGRTCFKSAVSKRGGFSPASLGAWVLPSEVGLQMMSVLAPVRRDRIIAELPQCFHKEAALHSRSSFHPQVSGACQEQRTGTVGRFKISKIIVVGDLSVGKTCLINRFCKDTFDKNYKATIGVDFEMERFEVLGVPFSLQLWDTAGQERFKCIASTYYRGAQAIVIVFDVNDVASLAHTRQWLADALKENDPSNVILFLVGSKKDLSPSAQYSLLERDAIKVAKEMRAEYWAVSSLTGENVREFFFRVASLTFESSVLAELEKSSARKIGDVVRIHSTDSDLYLTAQRRKSKCCR